MPGKAFVRFDDVEKRYGDVVALRPTSLEIAGGRTTVLVGESGSGKSTLLRLVVGLVWADAGQVTVGDVRVTAASVRGIRRGIGYVTQEGGLFPHLTARANVALVAEPMGWSPARVRSRLRDLAELARLPERMLDRYPGELSGGQRQRVSLIRALVLDPELLLLDEPLGALDAVTRMALQDELASIFSRLEKTVVLVTHDLAEAVFFADDLVALHAGEVVQMGPPQQLLEEPATPEVAALVEAWRRGAARVAGTGM